MTARLRSAIPMALISVLGAPPAHAGQAAGKATVSAELKKWHRVTLSFRGPKTGETAEPNPFMDYRLDVTFAHAKSGKKYVVPGYYAADGNAANSGASSGNVWRVHFAPDETGEWTYTASFRTGAKVAGAAKAGAGKSAGHFDGAAGSITIAATDKTGRDFRGKGRLEYVGKHHLRFAETKQYFLKCGADAPENFLAYRDFDGPFKTDGQKDKLVKTWTAHRRDWRSGDPTWMNGKGKGIIGAINYLASEGLNAFSFLSMNIGGDDRNVFPYTDYNERYRMDCSRLDQWEIVFEHADRMGTYLHFKTMETENELLLDRGDLGPQRKLYYRELIARFSHHLALNWNLGEEINNATTAQKKAWAQYLWDTDPYHHHIVIHNGANHYDLLGPGSKLTGFSLQTNRPDFSNVHSRTKNYIDRSIAAGKPWVVACDEPGDATHALRPDNDAGNSHTDGRKNALWGNLMAGGAGLEFYFGYGHAQSDLTCEDWRSRDKFWDYCRYALEFFNDNKVPFWDMRHNDELTGGDNWCLAKPGVVYVLYLPDGRAAKLDLGQLAAELDVRWYNPRKGGQLARGRVASVRGPGQVDLGPPPADARQDWVVLVTRKGAELTVPADPKAAGRTIRDKTPGRPVRRRRRRADAAGGGAERAAGKVTGLTLINAQTNRPVGGFETLKNGAVLDLSKLPTRRLNIRANTEPPEVGSVRFRLDGRDVQTESTAPYALAGDREGNYGDWAPEIGTHKLTATPYSRGGARGKAGEALSITFKVVDGR